MSSFPPVKSISQSNCCEVTHLDGELGHPLLITVSFVLIFLEFNSLSLQYMVSNYREQIIGCLIFTVSKNLSLWNCKALYCLESINIDFVSHECFKIGYSCCHMFDILPGFLHGIEGGPYILPFESLDQLIFSGGAKLCLSVSLNPSLNCKFLSYVDLPILEFSRL